MMSLSCNGRYLPVKSLSGATLSFASQNFMTASSVSCSKSHYDSLGVTPHATQSDVKAAYYKLSKMYHPDKNKGSDMASQKFREITSAYEVLGNFKLRRLYDKGILHTAGNKYQSEPSKPTEEDDATTRFYKSRMTRTNPPTMSGRTPIYNFDEWSQAHYGASFARKEAAKQKFNRKTTGDIQMRKDVQKELVIFSISLLIMIYIGFSYMQTQDLDVVDEKVKSPLNSSPQKPDRD